MTTIPGSAPEPTARPDGCPFRDRCPAAFDACSDPLPEHVIEGDHVARCHLYTEGDDPDDLAWDAPVGDPAAGGDAASGREVRDR